MSVYLSFLFQRRTVFRFLCLCGGQSCHFHLCSSYLFLFRGGQFCHLLSCFLFLSNQGEAIFRFLSFLFLFATSHRFRLVLGHSQFCSHWSHVNLAVFRDHSLRVSHSSILTFNLSCCCSGPVVLFNSANMIESGSCVWVCLSYLFFNISHSE